eukprot:scpid50380/ scgid23866/ Folylpolyglutamate synthase, mitochondrial; Folylpoly-gamma-glutamate synthetase; Tetrahydrofolylpolyglutamate synthase
MLNVAKRLQSTTIHGRCFMMSADHKSYQEAVLALNSLQSNAADIEKARQHPVTDKRAALADFERYMNRTGLTVSDLERLSIIHVSGTKGKGSTCAMVESILRKHGVKTGFFSSPHLVEVRERIRLNGQPLSYRQFSDYFWLCYNRLQESKSETDNSIPPYFRFLNLMTFHVFLQEKVDVAIMEVGIGGRFDTTNVVPPPVVCGISSLGYDHVALLGKTLKEIAWHKAGIMKTGTVAFTSPQADEGMASLVTEAKAVEVPLHVCPPMADYPPPLPDVGLAGEHQQNNASLALQLCKTWLQRTGREALLEPDGASSSPEGRVQTASVGQPTESVSIDVSGDASYAAERLTVPVAQSFAITPSMRQGLASVRWPGRCDVVKLPKVTIYLDGAHTVRSALACSQWFKRAAAEEMTEKGGSVCRVMLFNATGGRDPKSLLAPLRDAGIQAAAFCPNLTVTGPSTPIDMTNRMVTSDGVMALCRKNQSAWNTLHEQATPAPPEDSTDPGCRPVTAVLPCVQDALFWLCRHQNDAFQLTGPQPDTRLPAALQSADHVQVLVVGSLHLVGTALAVLRDCCNIDPSER